MKMINLRLPTGWTDPVPNKSPYHCDIDGRRLHVAPDGKQLFCDAVHEAKP